MPLCSLQLAEQSVVRQRVASNDAAIFVQLDVCCERAVVSVAVLRIVHCVWVGGGVPVLGVLAGAY